MGSGGGRRRRSASGAATDSGIELDAVVEHVPDPVHDRDALLALLMREDSSALLLASLLREHHWYCLRPLGTLLPGLGSDGPSFFHPGERTFGALARAGLGGSWSQLAKKNPAGLGAVAGVGSTTLEDILIAAVRQWAHMPRRRAAGAVMMGTPAQLLV